MSTLGIIAGALLVVALAVVAFILIWDHEDRSWRP